MIDDEVFQYITGNRYINMNPRNLIDIFCHCIENKIYHIDKGDYITFPHVMYMLIRHDNFLLRQARDEGYITEKILDDKKKRSSFTSRLFVYRHEFLLYQAVKVGNVDAVTVLLKYIQFDPQVLCKRELQNNGMLKDLNMSQKTREEFIKGMKNQANEYESDAIQKSFNLTTFAYWSLPTILITIAICMVLSVRSPQISIEHIENNYVKHPIATL